VVEQTARTSSTGIAALKKSRFDVGQWAHFLLEALQKFMQDADKLVSAPLVIEISYVAAPGTNSGRRWFVADRLAGQGLQVEAMACRANPPLPPHATLR
jgi:hypothetical protein